MDNMWKDIILQAAVFLLIIVVFLLIHNIPQKLISKIRYRDRPVHQAKRHFVNGAQLLAQARSSKDRSAVDSLAKSAESEADKAIAIDPTDAASHILKALALELQGFKTSALDSIDISLSPLAVKSLEENERGDALLKRAELRLAVSRRGQIDSVVQDLVESVRLKNDNAKAYFLLGECYEKKSMREEARTAYEDAIRVEPKYKVAREALDRLGS
ncbi:unnamed protein product [Ilex paraguariensis]|uniref:Uncharacterized protein n=1 Tax=Ilex paraguariensis TaxID=185542 RepID=A0ABC8T365_9AQUA